MIIVSFPLILVLECTVLLANPFAGDMLTLIPAVSSSEVSLLPLLAIVFLSICQLQQPKCIACFIQGCPCPLPYSC